MLFYRPGRCVTTYFLRSAKIFIGTHFRHILNYLRDVDTVSHLPLKALEELLSEAEYYALTELSARIQQLIWERQGIEESSEDEVESTRAYSSDINATLPSITRIRDIIKKIAM